MIDIANKYSEQLKVLFVNTWYDEKYKFYHDNTFSESYKPSDSNWSSFEFVSLSSDKEILGYIGFSIDRNSESVYSMQAINFSDNKAVFGRDLVLCIQDLFEKYNFRKLNFTVIVGNPIEKSYDKFINKYGGRIVGTDKEHVRLMDNKYYDSKAYEIFRDEYLTNKRECA